MKNLLIYTNPDKKFDDETNMMVKLQIDNSLELGWIKEDILLFTNFPFEYNGIISTVVDDELICEFDKTANKVIVINHLLNNNRLDKDIVYWYHDFDAYQNYPFTEKDLGLEEYDIGFISYTYKDEWNCGSFFFKTTARDIFNLWVYKIYDRIRKRVDEKVMTKLTKYGGISTTRYKSMNPTFNITKRYIPYVYSMSLKPLRVLHFHPYESDYKIVDSLIDIFIHGKNKLDKPLMSERLITLFARYGIK